MGEELLENVRDFMSFFTLGLGMQGVESMGLVKRMQRFGARSGPVDNIEHHLPADDLDGDRFSPARTLRGSDWRGKDCDDLRFGVHIITSSHHHIITSAHQPFRRVCVHVRSWV